MAAQKVPQFKGDVWHRNMSKYRSKNFIRLHPSGYGHGMFPAIDVKIPYGFYTKLNEAVQAEYPATDEARIEQAVEWAVESTCEDFWDAWTDAGEYNDPGNEVSSRYFGGLPVKVEQEGRSGGWMIVKGLPPIVEWDAVMLARWWGFVNAVCQDVDCRLDPSEFEYYIETIDANDWAALPVERILQEVY